MNAAAVPRTNPMAVSRSPVLRDVLLAAAPLTLRRQGRAGSMPEPPSSPGDHDTSVPMSGVEADATAFEAARRQGYEEGLASGQAEGRAHGEALARQRADEVAQTTTTRHEQALAERTEKLDRTLRHEAQARFATRFGVLDGLIAALPPRIEARLAAAEEDMLALAFEAVCRILGDQAVRPEALRAQVALALAGLRERKWVAVHLHPDDLAALAVDRDTLLDGADGPAIEWVASTEVASGGCIVQSPAGGLDARLETQLGLLRDLLVQTRAEVAAAPSMPSTDAAAASFGGAPT